MYLHSEVCAVGSPEPTLQADRDTARCDRNEPLFISHLKSGNPPLILDHCRGLFLPWSFNPSSETSEAFSQKPRSSGSLRQCQEPKAAEVAGLPAWSHSPSCTLNCRERSQRSHSQEGRVKMCSTWHLLLSPFSFREGRGGCKEGKKKEETRRKKFPSGVGGECIHPEVSLCLHFRRPASTFAQLGDTLGLSQSGARHRVAASASIFLHSPFPIPIMINIFILP